MKPDRRQQAEIWEILKPSPLVQKWPQFQSVVLPNADLVEYSPGEFVFRRGDAPRYLFIVVTGVVLIRLHEGGETWFEQELKPGQVFGQQALWDEIYRTTARVSPRQPASLLLIEASMLRVGLERMPELREELLHEARAARLRRVPLFRDLSDDQVRWVAQLVEERDLGGGEALALEKSPGIWMVDRGQLAVAGPLNPHPSEWDKWRITAGNFLVSQGSPIESADTGRAMHFGLECAAQSAAATVDSHLFFLPAVHANRLINQFPDMGTLIHQPLDITTSLGKTDLFQELTPVQRQHLAQFCGWEFVPEKQNITTQGDPGRAFVFLREGGALVTAFDNYGRERPRSRLEPGASYGRTSLLKGNLREVTVRAVRGEGKRQGVTGVSGADILTLDRQDFLHAVATRPDIWQGQPLASQIQTATNKRPEYAWLYEGESVEWYSRPHPLWLIWPLAAVLAALLILVIVVLLLPPEVALIGDIALLIFGGILVLVGITITINYYDDYYVITNRRVTRRDRQLIFFESRAEAPIEMVQDVTLTSDFWGQVFDYGDVTVRTASKGSGIQLVNVPRPHKVKDLLEEARTEAQADERGRQKEELRHGLIKDLHLALPVPPRQRALGDAPLPETGPAPSWFGRILRPRRRRPAAASRRPVRVVLASRLPERWRGALIGNTPPPAGPQVLPGMVTWRKHWLNAVARAGPPFLAFAVVLVLGLILFTGGFGSVSVSGVGWFLGWLVLLAGLGFWLWWEFTNYRNDVYQVTDDRIIDTEKTPLGLSEKRREGGLERVQNVVFEQNGIWAKVFGYGNVVISTAAADEGFTFLMVPKPSLVQAVIFQKLNQFRLRDERRRASQRQQELIEALSVYHQLRGGGTQADGFS